MGETTAIAWTDATFNPWWGCERVSEGCQHCYAETFAKRTGNIVWGKNADRRRFGDKHWNEPVKWNRDAEKAGERRRVFCASMADVFEDRDDHEEDRERLFELVTETPWLDWQLLTKRPENVMGMVPHDWTGCSVEEWAGWPGNVWIGTTCENQRRYEERIGHLLDIPAPVRFLSCEPLLGHVSLNYVSGGPDIQWLIVGGESGPKHRPLNVDDARSLRNQCEEAGIAFFFKQHGGQHPASGGDLLDGVQHKNFPRRDD